MFFRTRYHTPYGRNRKDEAELTLALDGDHVLTVTLRTAEGKEGESDTTICEARGEWNVEPGLQTLLDDLEAQRMPKDLVGKKFDTGTGVELEGTVVPLEALPHGYDAFASDVQLTLHAAVESAIRQWRWRHDLPGPHRPTSSTLGTDWSADGATWRGLVTGLYAEVGTRGYRQLDASRLAEVQALVNSKDQEPVAFELLREAESVRQTAPRSALVIAVAALEVGFKQYVASRVPDAAWLIENIQSPSMFRLLHDYLPTLVDEARFPPDRLLTVVNKAVEMRNKTVHRGVETLKSVDLRPIFAAVSDLLRLFDYYRGYDWALEHLTSETRAELRLEA